MQASPAVLENCTSTPQEATWCRYGFWLFLAAHSVLWTLLPTFSQPNAPLDVVEIVYWGHEWQLGYIKHPPLPSYLSELARVWGGDSTWAIYALSQISVGLAFWAIWRLAGELLPPRLALLSVLLLDSCYFYNVATPEFNHGVCLYAPWALAIYWLYRGLQSSQKRYWIGTGVALGLGLLTKYNAIMLALPMLAFTILHPRARSAWRTAGPYLTIACAAVLFLPHFLWAVENSLSGVDYALRRTRSDASLLSRLVNPLGFMSGQLLIVLPVCLLATPLIGWRWKLRAVQDDQRYRRDFLLTMFLGPLVAYLLTSLLLNVRLRTPYGSCLWLLAGVVLLASLEWRYEPRLWRRSVVGSLLAGALLAMFAAGRNVAGPHLRGTASRIHFPGKELAVRVVEVWKQRFGRPLPVVAGEWWLAGNVSYYDPSRPSVYCGGYFIESVDLIPQYSPWTNDADLQRRGGVILWNSATLGNALPATLRARFPSATTERPITLSYQTTAQLPPVCVGMAIVPPVASVRSAASDALPAAR